MADIAPQSKKTYYNVTICNCLGIYQNTSVFDIISAMCAHVSLKFLHLNIYLKKKNRHSFININIFEAHSSTGSVFQRTCKTLKS